MTILLGVALLGWPLGLLDWRTWQHALQEWDVARKIHARMSLDEVLAAMPPPTRTAGHSGTQYVEFKNGEIVVELDFSERLERVAVKSPTGQGTSNWLIGAMLTLLGAYTAYLWWRDRRAPAGHCPHCSYNLRGNVSGRCPECGHMFARLASATSGNERASVPDPSSTNGVERPSERA